MLGHRRISGRLARLAGAGLARLPRRTVRLRLTMLYGGLFLVSGAALLAVTYLLVVNATAGIIFEGQSGDLALRGMYSGKGATSQEGGGPTEQRIQIQGPNLEGLTPQQAQAQAAQLKQQALHQHDAELRRLLTQSGIALAVMSVLSIVLGWFIAGRVLRKLRTITTTVRNISATSLHDRLALDGPDDELKELGDTFDGLLARLEAAFQAQRRFVANASHELRTPLARQRVLAQVALADPDASLHTLRVAHERVLASGRQQEQLIEALLTLAKGQVGLDRYETFDLAALADDILVARQAAVGELRLDVDARLRPALAAGDRRLVRQLIANLVDNAIRHNISPGWIAVATRISDGHAVMSVTNSGPFVPPEEVDRLVEPFHRLGADRTSHTDGHGLGLSIVQAIATTHHAAVTARSRPAGGLEIEVVFPLISSDGPAPTGRVPQRDEFLGAEAVGYATATH
ncbi:sensor histidine kinase [Actinopolymorpha pittospori]|uniref:histidine kinase n=1 Tax=Actinopolymorpha pittospori TaxID=648752 RepID=A0A927MP84_9ACTN|nr:ATP-binding protein [Actinopolymorpha pittospori]MBE1604164.1 signal transduction histidine kinase [Actinopolymorpha pittospori]